MPWSAEYFIRYDLDSLDGETSRVTLFLSVDGGATFPFVCQAVSGDVGEGIMPGSGKIIMWDADVDYPGLYDECQLRVTAEAPSGFVLISAGTFMMGSSVDEFGRGVDEVQHEVTLTHDYWMSPAEVTTKQYVDLVQWAYDNGYCTATNSGVYDALDGSTELLLQLNAPHCEVSFSDGIFSIDAGKEDHPIKELCWYGAATYCDWLSLLQSLPRAYDHSTWLCGDGDPYLSEGYRLPTEAEWEYACRAGTVTSFSFGVCLSSDTDGNCDGNWPTEGCPAGPYIGWTVPVRSYLFNEYELYDMHGNLWEWCNDWYGDYAGDETDPVGPASGAYRVCRGGYWAEGSRVARSAEREYTGSGNTTYKNGIRVVRSQD